MLGLQQISLLVSVVSTANINAVTVKYKEANRKTYCKDQYCNTTCMYIHPQVSLYGFLIRSAWSMKIYIEGAVQCLDIVPFARLCCIGLYSQRHFKEFFAASAYVLQCYISHRQRICEYHSHVNKVDQIRILIFAPEHNYCLHRLLQSILIFAIGTVNGVSQAHTQACTAG